jgi:hypothetical protein
MSLKSIRFWLNIASCKPAYVFVLHCVKVKKDINTNQIKSYPSQNNNKENAA